MSLASLQEFLKWVGDAVLLAAGAGLTAAAIMEGVKNVLATVGVVLSGLWAGYLASAATVLVVAYTLVTAQGCPLLVALGASIVAFFVPHGFYNLYAANRAKVNAPVTVDAVADALQRTVR